MSATIDSRPLFLRATSVMFALVQSGLMLAGIILLAGLFALSQGDRRVVEKLSSLLPGDDDAVTMVAYGLPAAEDESTIGELSPRMRAALESVSRRYRVSMGPLEPIFAAAEGCRSGISARPPADRVGDCRRVALQPVLGKRHGRTGFDAGDAPLPFRQVAGGCRRSVVFRSGAECPHRCAHPEGVDPAQWQSRRRSAAVCRRTRRSGSALCSPGDG